VAAFIVGYISIAWLLSFISRRSLRGFAYYCMALGALVILVSYVD